MKYDDPVFDPFRDGGPTHFHPADLDARRLVGIELIYRDIAKLAEISVQNNDEYTKLIAKYIIIELLSIDENIRKLSNRIIGKNTEIKASESEREAVKKQLDQYLEVFNKKSELFKTVRDKIAAHHDPIDLTSISTYWSQIDKDDIIGICAEVKKLFDVLKDVNIYRWTKSEIDLDGNSVHAYVSPLIFKD